MGKASKALKDFIDEIPDSNLEALPPSGGTIYTTKHFRLDMQGVSWIYSKQLLTRPLSRADGLMYPQMTGSQEHYNLQIQVNTTLKKFAPKTAAGPVLVPSDNPWSAEKIKEELRNSIII